MIERDYIMRILKQFFDMLQKLINNIDTSKDEVFELELSGLCEKFLGNSIEFYSNIEDHDILTALGQGSPRELQARATMLSELLYHRVVSLDNDQGKARLAKKVLTLLNFINEHSNTYSFERLSRISQMETMLL